MCRSNEQFHIQTLLLSYSVRELSLFLQLRFLDRIQNWWSGREKISQISSFLIKRNRFKTFLFVNSNLFGEYARKTLFLWIVWIPGFFRCFFLNKDTLYLTDSHERKFQEGPINIDCFRIFLIFRLIYNFFEVFCAIFLSVIYSHVLTIIRFHVKFPRNHSIIDFYQNF